MQLVIATGFPWKIIVCNGFTCSLSLLQVFRGRQMTVLVTYDSTMKWH